MDDRAGPIAELIEESSLGTPGARRLRARTSMVEVEAVRAMQQRVDAELAKLADVAPAPVRLPTARVSSGAVAVNQLHSEGSEEERTDRDHDLAALVRAAADGDQQAWDALVDRFAGLLWSISRRYWLNEADAADACQMTWLRLLEHLGSIKDPARLPGWLSTTCQRECLALLRRSGRTVPSGDAEFLDARVSPVEETDHPVLVKDLYSTLWAAFGQLNDRCQRLLRVLIADAEEGPPSYQGAAVTLGMPIGSLGPTRARCLDRLRSLLDSAGI